MDGQWQNHLGIGSGGVKQLRADASQGLAQIFPTEETGVAEGPLEHAEPDVLEDARGRGRPMRIPMYCEKVDDPTPCHWTSRLENKAVRPPVETCTKRGRVPGESLKAMPTPMLIMRF